MAVFKFYDACCDKCDNWYSTEHKTPKANSKKEALEVMTGNGWFIKGKLTLCKTCK